MTLLASENTGADGRLSAHDARTSRFEWNLRTDTWNWESTVFDIYGTCPEDMATRGTAFLTLKHPDDVRTRHAMLQMLKNGNGGSYTHRVFRGDGSVRHVRSSAHVDFDSHHHPSMMCGTLEALSDWEHPLSGCDLTRASDGVLMLCFRAEMPEALAEAFRRHGGSVAGFVRHLGYPAVNADDVVQDVFEGLCRKQSGYDPRRGSLSSYLRMQARSSSIDQVRSHTKRRTRELAHNPDVTPSSPEDDALSSLSRGSVRSALAGLDDDERIPLELAYVEGLSYRAVANHLHLPEGTVKARISRGLRKLRTSTDLSNLAVGWRSD